METDNTVQFLVVLVQESRDQKLLTNWYVKLTNSGRIVNYLSTHPMGYEINAISNFLFRSIKLSDPTSYNDNLLKIKCILKKNTYPKKFSRKKFE